jgi:endogenous inhibitor of DNA gyrase (YacG/DUF329 family)
VSEVFFSAHCPTCDTQVELIQKAAYSTYRPAEEAETEGPETGETPYVATEYILCCCPTCESPFLFKSESYEIPGEYSTAKSEPDLLYPEVPPSVDESEDEEVPGGPS